MYGYSLIFNEINSEMATKHPVVTIQCDWNDALRLPKSKAWLSSKYLNENSVHDEVTTSVSPTDGKIKIITSNNYECLSYSNLGLVLKYLPSQLKVVFVPPTKTHLIHHKGVLSTSAAENALMVSSDDSDKLLVWDSRTGEILQDLKGHGGPAYKCRFFPSGQVVLSAGADGSCKIWSADTGINPVTLQGHTMAVMDLAIVEKGRNVISVSRDGTAKLWDVGESNCLDNIMEGCGSINCCSIANTNTAVEITNEREVGTSNKLLIAGTEAGLVVCAHVGSRQELFRQQLDSPCNASTVVEDRVIFGCENGKVYQLSLQTGEVLGIWHESANPVRSLITLSSNLFAVGRQDGTCTVVSQLELHQATRVYLTGSDCDGIRDIAFNGKWVFTACRDSNVRKYDFNQILVHYK